MLSEHKAQADGHTDLIRASILQIMLIALRHKDDEIATTDDQSSAKHKTISEIAAYINNNFNRDITLAEISERFFISPCYFSRTFKSITGISFSEYLSGVRIKEAERLLAKTEMSISDIAEAVGFNSITHFGRCFKSAAGMTPLAYRRTRRK
jgi:AraC-like DNA-binding protein